MEEDIEIIEDNIDMFMDTLYECYRQSKVKPFEKAIKNLIARYKELEEENIELKNKSDENLAYYDQIYKNGIYTGQKAVEEKIKEKITEEIEKEIEVKRNILNFTNDRVDARILSDDINTLYKVKKVLEEFLD